MKMSVKCSRCGESSQLSLVTIRYDEDCESGRLLVYCRQCCAVFSEHINVNIPLSEVTVESFLDLYRTNQTSSDPIIASEIVFGAIEPEVVKSAQRYIEKFKLLTKQ